MLFRSILDAGARPGAPATAAVRSWPGIVVAPVAALLFVLGAANLARTAGLQLPGVGWQRVLAPLHLCGGYGLFAHMTTQRPEIVVEGSLAGSTWQTYEIGRASGRERVSLSVGAVPLKKKTSQQLPLT